MFKKTGAPEEGHVVLDVPYTEDGKPDIRPIKVEDDVGEEEKDEDAADEE